MTQAKKIVLLNVSTKENSAVHVAVKIGKSLLNVDEKVRKVLMVDLDLQAQLTEHLFLQSNAKSIEDVYEKYTSPYEYLCARINKVAISKLEAPNLLKISNNLHLLVGDIRIAEIIDPAFNLGKGLNFSTKESMSSMLSITEFIDKACEKLDADYSVIFASPSTSFIALSALEQSDYFALLGANDYFSQQKLSSFLNMFSRSLALWQMIFPQSKTSKCLGIVLNNGTSTPNHTEWISTNLSSFFASEEMLLSPDFYGEQGLICDCNKLTERVKLLNK